jgi:hypothetical protein
MHFNPSNCCSPQSLRVYDRAPVNFRNQTVHAYVEPMRDISYDLCVICAEIDICKPCLEDLTMCPVPGRPLMKRVTGCITAPVRIEYKTKCSRGTVCVEGIISLPFDVLVRVPEVAPYDLRVLIDQAIVSAVEYCGNNMFAMRVTVCAALFVVVESPCCEPACPPFRPPHWCAPDPCRPSLPAPPICPPVCPPQRPVCPPQRPVCPPVCSPKRPHSPMPWLGPPEPDSGCGWGPKEPPQKPQRRPERLLPDCRPVPCLPLYPPDAPGRHGDCW